MSDGYMPTSEQIREAYQRVVTEPGGVYERIAKRTAEFDRWLVEHDKEVAAAARREALREAVEYINSNGMISRRDLEPYWEGWDDATTKAAEEVRALAEGEQS